MAVLVGFYPVVLLLGYRCEAFGFSFDHGARHVYILTPSALPKFSHVLESIQVVVDEEEQYER